LTITKIHATYVEAFGIILKLQIYQL